MSLFDVARHERFQGRVRLLAVKTALDVAAEDVGTPSHAQRLALAGRVFQATMATDRLVEVVLVNPAIAATAQSDPNGDGSAVTNADILAQLASVWTPLALALEA